MAIKTVVFQKGEDDAYTSLVASEAAIASNLVHKNVVTTYSHDIRNIIIGPGPEHSIYKFYLLQVRCHIMQAAFWLFLTGVLGMVLSSG